MACGRSNGIGCKLGARDGWPELVADSTSRHSLRSLVQRPSYKIDPDLDLVRDDPRFKAMLATAEVRLAKSS